MCKQEITKSITLKIDKKEAMALSRKIEEKICKDIELKGFHYEYEYIKEEGGARFILIGSEEIVREYSELLKV